MEALGPKYPFGPLPQIESPDMIAKRQAQETAKVLNSSNEGVTQKSKSPDMIPDFKQLLENKATELNKPVADQDETKRLRKAAQDLESYFIYSILKKFNEGSMKGGLFGNSSGSDIYNDMFFQGIAEEMSKGPNGLGIADTMIRDMQSKLSTGVSINPYEMVNSLRGVELMDTQR